jgi:hypothetical protein
MKKIVVFILILMFSVISGCDDMEDMVDFEIDITETEAFPVASDGTNLILGVNVDLTDNSDYSEYDGYLKDIEIKRFDYRVAQNLGDAGSFTLYVAPIDPAITDLTTAIAVPASATQITGPITFEAGITTENWMNVTLLEKSYFEDLFFNERKFTLWVEVTPSGALPVLVELVARIKIQVTANLFEKI